MNHTNALTIHIALSTLPQQDFDGFVEDVELNFYNSFLDRAKDIFSKKDLTHFQHGGKDVLYKPLKYFIFGNYDIAFISLIDRFKFAQKVFAPTEDATANPATFQVITGITRAPGDDGLKALMSQLHGAASNKKFVAIINLKINNGLLVGSGQFFLDKTLQRLELLVEEVKQKEDLEYILQQSFSWFEISLLVFCDSPTRLSTLIKTIREQEVGFLNDPDSCIRDSHYFRELSSKETDEKKKIQRIRKTHVFADTHTYMGINWHLFKDPQESDFESLKSMDLETEIEWMVKPGHFNRLKEVLKNDSALNEVFDLGRAKLLLGKSDYFIAEHNSSLQNNLSLYGRLYKKGNNLYDHVKKVKTRVMLPIDSTESAPAQDKMDEEQSGISSITTDDLKVKLHALLLKNSEIKYLVNILKKLKISRLIRNKTAKVLINYNNGLQDPILYSFFLDFSIFIHDFINAILKEEEKLNVFKDYKLTGTGSNDFEESLIKRIEGFEESFTIRMLNSYQFEDLNDFDLDFNASIQQLLTTFNTLAIEIANVYYPKKYLESRVVQLNFKNTIANQLFINYSVFHLLCPEFVCFTISKEVLNYYDLAERNFEGEDGGRKKHVETKEKLREMLRVSHPFLTELDRTGKIDIDYLVLDAVRLCIQCNFDFRIFTFWFWSYNLQNSSLYNAYGMMEERNFTTELVRYILLSKMFEIPATDLKCPIKELELYWERYYGLLDEVISGCFKDKSFDELFSEFKSQVYKLVERSIGHTGQTEFADSTFFKWEEKFGKPDEERFNQIMAQYITMLTRLTERLGKEITGKPTTRIEYFYKSNLWFDHKYGEHIRNGKPVLYNKEEFRNPQMFIVALIFSYLRILYSLNGPDVHLLRRNWENGEVYKCFLDSDEDDFLYYVDQTGGTFFSCPKQMSDYFKIRNGTLQSLWHFSAYMKKDLLFEIKKPSIPKTEKAAS
ncbi:MAG: hypothetical protein WDO19_03925 [Bacteroidota bacterium]